MIDNDKIIKLPSLKCFGKWEDLQYYLGKKGNPLYSIDGGLNLRYSDVKSLGNLTSVGEYLDLAYTDIESLGNLTSVGGFLWLMYSDIKSLENLTSVGGNLDLARCKNLTSLGNLTSVGGHLDLSRTPLSKKYTIEEIRNMVKVGGDIYL